MQKKTKDALRRADFIVASALALTVLMGGACTAYAPSTDKSLAALPVATRAVALPSAAQIVAADVAQQTADVVQPNAVVPQRVPTDAEVEGLKILAKTECLADAMYYEARGEGEAGELAIAEVVYNRLHDGNYPRNICGVVFEGAHQHTCQFSFTCNGEMLRPKEPAAWRRAERLALRIVTGNLALGDSTGGALSFHAVAVQPGWSDMERTTQIGNHVFYRRHSFTRGA
jgi:spore germination cell wall hydrolase CwlJ-like protein